MGIRQLAADAQQAQDAAAKSERRRVGEANARRGEATVKRLLGLDGTTVRANNSAERPHGVGSVVRIPDDDGTALYVKVCGTERTETGWDGRRHPTGEWDITLVVTTATGGSLATLVNGRPHYWSPPRTRSGRGAFSDLAGLGKILADLDAWCEQRNISRDQLAAMMEGQQDG